MSIFSFFCILSQFSCIACNIYLPLPISHTNSSFTNAGTFCNAMKAQFNIIYMQTHDNKRKTCLNLFVDVIASLAPILVSRLVTGIYRFLTQLVSLKKILFKKWSKRYWFGVVQFSNKICLGRLVNQIGWLVTKIL